MAEQPVDKARIMNALDFLTSKPSAAVIEGHAELATELQYVKTALGDVPPEGIIEALSRPNTAERVNSIRQAVGRGYVQSDVEYLLKIADRDEIRQHGMLPHFEAMRREDLGLMGRMKEDFLKPRRTQPGGNKSGWSEGR